MGDRVAVHRDDFTPKYKAQDCTGCVFLGKYTYQAQFNTGPRKTTADLYVCLGKIDPSIIARFGSAPSKYASHPIDASIEEWLSTWAKNRGVKPTHFEAMQEAWRRALVLGLVNGVKWDRDGNDWSDGNFVALDLHVRAKSELGLEALLPMAKAYAEQLSYHIKWDDKTALRTFNCDTGSVSARVALGPEHLRPPSPNPSSPPTPFDPLTFLQTIASDALERAARLESGAAKVFTAHDADEQREAAARYRLRAEAYKIAALEMKLEMEKRGMGPVR